jgi:hypothetical protein
LTKALSKERVFEPSHDLGVVIAPHDVVARDQPVEQLVEVGNAAADAVPAGRCARRGRDEATLMDHRLASSGSPGADQAESCSSDFR